MVVLYGLTVLTGFLVKLTDAVVDERFKPNFFGKIDSFLGFAYGALGGFLASRSTIFATTLIAITIGVLLAGKIDRRAHQYGIAGFILSLAFFGLPSLHLAVFSLLILACVIDEFAHDFFEYKKGILAKFFSLRLLLELTALLTSIYLNDFTLFLVILCFDAGYQLASLLSSKLPKSLTIEGRHLVLDLSDCNRARLSDEKFVKEFLKKLPSLVGMQRIGEPMVRRLPQSKSGRDPGGVSGIVLIAESHISIHTFPLLRAAHVDVFSCKSFDVKKIESIVKESFGAKIVLTKVIER